MKLFFTLMFIYLAYKYFFNRPLIRPPHRQDYYPPRDFHTAHHTNSNQRKRNTQDSEDYVDYEEVE